MYDQTLPHYVGLDVGTSMVRCVVGMLDPHDQARPSVIGYGHAINHGMRRGVVVHTDEVAEAIMQAVTEAERLSGVQIRAATVNINGAHVTGNNSKGVVAISSANREITPEDRSRVEEAASILQLPVNREIVQVFAKSYRLDGQDNIKDPIGMRGVRLEVDTHIVTAATPNLRNLDLALEKAQITPVHRTIAGPAAAEAVLERQQKEAGTALIDIGAGTINLVVIEDGEIQHVAVLPIGGIHITNDLAIGLKTDLDIAEQVKLEYATLDNKTKKDTVTVHTDAGDHTFQTSEIAMITEARVDEMFDYIEKELRKIQRSRKLPGGVVLTGGTAKLSGLADFAREKLQLAARVGQLHGVSGLTDTVDDPALYTAVGLMLLDMLLTPAHQTFAGNSSAKLPRTISNLFNRFKF